MKQLYKYKLKCHRPMENPLVMTWPYYYLILTKSFEISVPNSYLYVDFQLKMLRLKN
jgi:hypothetical protein